MQTAFRPYGLNYPSPTAQNYPSKDTSWASNLSAPYTKAMDLEPDVYFGEKSGGTLLIGLLVVCTAMGAWASSRDNATKSDDPVAVAPADAESTTNAPAEEAPPAETPAPDPPPTTEVAPPPPPSTAQEAATPTRSVYPDSDAAQDLWRRMLAPGNLQTTRNAYDERFYAGYLRIDEINVGNPAQRAADRALWEKMMTYGIGSSPEQRVAWVNEAIDAILHYSTNETLKTEIRNDRAKAAANLLFILERESKNPLGINISDDNAGIGQHTMGCMQTTPNNFNAYKIPGYDNPFNPPDSIITAAGYMIHRYGSIQAARDFKAANGWY